MFPVGVVLRNQAVEHSMASFQAFPLLYKVGSLSRG